MPVKNKGKKPPKIPGTNKLDIDSDQVELLAQRFWKQSEIAAFFNVAENTIKGRFADIIIKGKEKGKARLRDAQLKVALSGNVVMLIWLGKQYLEQREPEKNEVLDTPETPPDFDNMNEKELDDYINSHK